MMWSPLFWGVFFFVLSESVVKGRHERCFKECERDFSKVHNKLLRSLRALRHPPPPPVHHSADSCQAFTRTEHVKDRSLSPWRTRTVKNTDMYPLKYEEAECLCDGCIIDGAENMSYNSVPLMNDRLFLKKLPCPSDPEKYTLEFVTVSVSVGCTCVVPRQ